ncbi:MAG: Omp28-related outer membrane protein [Bacteroidota bacterium]|jgi:Outer membrane protein Omp28
MKDLKIYLSVCILLSIVFSSCKEEPPYINYTKPQSTFDTSYIISPIPAAQLKEVLIEDGSGASCINCPTAAQMAEGIVVANLAANPSRSVNVYTIYPNLAFGGLTFPVNKPPVVSKYDFRTDVGSDIINFVTVPGSIPSGYIDRAEVSSTWFIPYTNWSSIVTSELTQTTPVNIDIASQYNSSSNKLTVNLTLTYTKSDSGNNFINIVILQDSMIDAQESKDANGLYFYDSVYVHNHTLMDMLTAHTGDLLNSTTNRTLVPGRVFKISYEKILSPRNSSPSVYPQPQWDPKHLSVLAFVTRGLPTKYVLQSKKVEVQ